METAIRIEGSHFIIDPRDIRVLDFVAWIPSAKGRRFHPIAVLQSGDYVFSLDGYDSVWSFIDAIQPRMPRKAVNAAMKGDTLHEQTVTSDVSREKEEDEWLPFARELEAFCRESEVSTLLFDGLFAKDGKKLPNLFSKIGRHYEVKSCEVLKAFYDSETTIEDHRAFHSRFIYRGLPNYLFYFDGFAVRLTRIAKDEFIVRSQICVPEGVDYRPYRQKTISTDTEWPEVDRCFALLREYPTDLPLLNSYAPDDLGLMTEEERDEIEWMRAQRAFLSAS
tara:strand:+ start:5033 stop:5869 length:837 start_codon:yes stop_codon:yes gene_type:complete